MQGLEELCYSLYLQRLPVPAPSDDCCMGVTNCGICTQMSIQRRRGHLAIQELMLFFVMSSPYTYSTAHLPSRLLQSPDVSLLWRWRNWLWWGSSACCTFCEVNEERKGYMCCPVRYRWLENSPTWVHWMCIHQLWNIYMDYTSRRTSVTVQVSNLFFTIVPQG